jgi:hypothetical protein
MEITRDDKELAIDLIQKLVDHTTKIIKSNE